MTTTPTTTTPTAPATKAPAPVTPQIAHSEQPTSKPANGYWWGTGRRKTAVARVRIKPGSGKFLVNEREVDHYFNEPEYRNGANAPLKATDMTGKLDVFVKVHGGGPTGQAGAVVVGLARALKNYDQLLEAALRKHGFLTIDDRQVERKKYGQSGARRRFQFSKR